jgi:hypothetical protein
LRLDLGFTLYGTSGTGSVITEAGIWVQDALLNLGNAMRQQVVLYPERRLCHLIDGD